MLSKRRQVLPNNNSTVTFLLSAHRLLTSSFTSPNSLLSESVSIIAANPCCKVRISFLKRSAPHSVKPHPPAPPRPSPAPPSFPFARAAATTPVAILLANRRTSSSNGSCSKEAWHPPATAVLAASPSLLPVIACVAACSTRRTPGTSAERSSYSDGPTVYDAEPKAFARAFHIGGDNACRQDRNEVR